MLKYVSKLVLKGLTNAIYFARHVIAHANHALMALKIFALNVQMDLDKIQIFYFRVLNDVSKHALQGLFLAMMELA